MPSLQMHQLRVAAVGKLICEHLDKPVRTEDVVVACLFHDMGNILKFDLGAMPGFLEPEGLEYWQKVKEEFNNKYGTEQHSATEKIARELKLPQAILEILGATGFSRIAEVAASSSMETKIVQYADMRVGPFGILPFKERLADLSRRYAAKKNHLSEAAERGCYDIERQIFTQAHIEAHLGDLDAHQQEDGGWPILWQPPGEIAQWEWRGHKTVSALYTLRAYGRI